MDKIIFVALVSLFGVSIVGGDLFYHYGTQDHVIETVTEKERIQDKVGSGSKYLIFTENETFENTDSLFYLKYSSSDFYRELEEGSTYRFDVYGWRIPFFSSYRNIVGYREIKQ